jgi:hypothetical protein
VFLGWSCHQKLNRNPARTTYSLTTYSFSSAVPLRS